jgi:acyl transferase domain-containing protein
MHEDGVRTFVEVGPSDVLTKCVGLILGDKPYTAVSMDKRKDDSNLFFLLGVAQLLSEGRVQNLDVLWQGYRNPSYPFSDTREDKKEEQERSLRRLDLEFARIDRLRSANGQ